MAKVTEEQKALNKAASKLRNAAFKARRDAYQSALSKALAAVEDSDLSAQAQKAEADEKAFDERHQMQCGALREQIAALETQLKALQESPELVQVRERRRTARGKLYAKRREAEDAVSKEFADVSSIFTAAAWRSLDEYLPAAAGQVKNGSTDVDQPDDRCAPDEKGGRP